MDGAFFPPGGIAGIRALVRMKAPVYIAANPAQ